MPLGQNGPFRQLPLPDPDFDPTLPVHIGMGYGPYYDLAEGDPVFDPTLRCNIVCPKCGKNRCKLNKHVESQIHICKDDGENGCKNRWYPSNKDTQVMPTQK